MTAGHPESSRGATVVGVLSVVWLLAVAASVPIVGVLVLGYLLVVEGAVARGLPLRDAFPGLRRAPRTAATLIVGWLAIVPARLLWAAEQDAAIVSSTGKARLVVGALAVLASALGLWLISRRVSRPDWRAAGARLFAWAETGAKVLAGAALWLAPPSALWILARGADQPHPGLALLGGALLVPVLCWLPFLQVHFAVEQRWRALFEWRVVRDRFRRAPVAFFVALVLTYALTLPLYLLKVVLPPRDAAWLVTIFFVGTMLPVRLLLAWAWRRALRREAPVTGWLAWPARLTLMPLLAVYAALLFLAPLVDTHGELALFTHHVFMVPSPF